MKQGNGRLIYEGVKETLNGKAAFMEAALAYKQVREEIGKRLAEDDVLRSRLKCVTMPGERGVHMRLDLEEEDLELLFDVFNCRNTKRFLDNSDDITKIVGAPLLTSKYEVEIDITYYVANAMIMNESCRRKLEEALTEREEYYAFWEKSAYNYPEFEDCVPIEYIWDFRTLIGMLEKLRQEEETIVRKYLKAGTAVSQAAKAVGSAGGKGAG